MSTRITLRLPVPLRAQLIAITEREGQDLSAVVRRLVQHALDGSPGVGKSTALQAAPAAAATPHRLGDCMDTILTALPRTMQAELRERSSRVGLHVSSLVW